MVDTDTARREGETPSADDASSWLRGWSHWRPFVEVAETARHRRIADLLIFIVGVLALVLLSIRASEVTAWEEGIAQFFLQAPEWVSDSLDWLLRLGSLWVVVVLAGGALAARRWRLARDLALAGGLAWVVGRALALAIDPQRRDELTQVFTADDLPSYPVIRVAVITALVATASPYLVSAIRKPLNVLPFVVAAAALMVPIGLPGDVAAAMVLGYTIGAAVHLLFGSPEGRPTLEQVVAHVGELGVAVHGPSLEEDPPWGEVVVEGFDGQGRPLRVKALGADAQDAKLLARIWHRMWYRGGVDDGGSPLERVNREALVTLLAERAHVSVPSVVAVGGSRALALLVERRLETRPLADLEPDELTPLVLDRLWRAVATLHGARLAHGALDLHRAGVTVDGEIQLSDLSRASTPAPPELQRDDLAGLLAATALVVGPERAVRSAHRVLGNDPLVAALPYLQQAALSPELRDAVHAHNKATKTKLLPDLQRWVIAATGTPAPEPVKLQRISWKGVAMVAATLFGVYLLMSQVSDLNGALEELKDADWAWVVLALFTAQLPAFTDAVATQGAVAQTLAYGPLVVLQYAQKFTGLVVPSTLGTTAMNVRYLTLQSVPVATAVSSGVLVSLGGFVTQAIAFVIFFVISGPDLDLGSIDASTVGKTILLAVIAVGALVTLVYVVPKLRTMIVPRVKGAAHDVWTVLRTPSKSLRILGGNFASQLFYAITLGFSLMAYGESLSLPALFVVNTASSLLAGLMPVPGGIGVAEASLAAGLMAYGVPPTIAGAAALTHRLVTFYLPPIWGWVAFRWLNKHEYL